MQHDILTAIIMVGAMIPVVVVAASTCTDARNRKSFSGSVTGIHDPPAYPRKPDSVYRRMLAVSCTIWNHYAVKVITVLRFHVMRLRPSSEARLPGVGGR